MITLQTAKNRLKAYFQKWPFQEGEGVSLTAIDEIDNVTDFILFIEEIALILRNSPPGIEILSKITIE